MKKKRWPRTLRERLSVEFCVSQAVSRVEAHTFPVINVQAYGPDVLMFTASMTWSTPIKPRVREHAARAARAARVALQGRVNSVALVVGSVTEIGPSFTLALPPGFDVTPEPGSDFFGRW